MRITVKEFKPLLAVLRRIHTEALDPQNVRKRLAAQLIVGVAPVKADTSGGLSSPSASIG